MNKTEINQTSKTFCQVLLVTIGNSTFCGLNKIWKPRFNKSTLLVMSIIPVALYWIVLFAFIKTLFKSLIYVWKIRVQGFHQSNIETIRRRERNGIYEIIDNVICYTPYCSCIIFKDDFQRYKLFVADVLIVTFKYFWDAIDLTLDVYIFYHNLH